MSLQAGRLRHRVSLQYPEYTQDATTGENTLAWVEAAHVWASIEPVSAREFVESQATQSQVSARIVIRSRPDVAASWRAVHYVNGLQGKVYNIHGVLADRESGLEYQTLVCSAGVNTGE